MSPMTGSTMLSRSQSVATLSSSDSSGGNEMYQPSPSFAPIDTSNRMVLTRSESDLSQLDVAAGSRQRSQSSPQVIGEPGRQSPSSGKAIRLVRPSPLNLQRQNSYHGSSASPHRPAQLVRANSITGGTRRSRPTSLAASAFGITPIVGEAYSPLGSPSTSSSNGTHSRGRSDTSLTPFTTSVAGMTISPDISDLGEPGAPFLPMSIPPLTPITPAHVAANGVFSNAEYGELHTEVNYANMPYKQYTAPQFVHQHEAYVPRDFGPNYVMSQAESHPHGSWQ